MCWMWWKLDNNNGRRWNINPITKLTIDGIITTTMELIEAQTDRLDAIGIVELIYKIWTQQQIIKLMEKQQH